MKRADVLKRITTAAKAANVAFELSREGANHAVYSLGGRMIPVPRHREIDNDLAEKIFKECEPTLGRRWWK